jgi:predicted Zn-dependent protease
VSLSALLVAPGSELRGEWSESLDLGAATQLPRMLARATLLALGEDSSAPAQSVEPALPAEAVLRLARATRRIVRGEVDDGVEDLLALIEATPARRALLQSARAAIGGDRMPVFFSALERLAEARPDDAEALLALADYRALHLDEKGARDLYLRARDTAEDRVLSSQASAGLAVLAQDAGRNDEAILHLRAAVRLQDDPRLYARLGALLLGRDATEGLQMLTRATVLAPDDAGLQLALARAIREHGGDLARALAAATRAARLGANDAALAEEVRAELEILLRE